MYVSGHRDTTVSKTDKPCFQGCGDNVRQPGDGARGDLVFRRWSGTAGTVIKALRVLPAVTKDMIGPCMFCPHGHSPCWGWEEGCLPGCFAGWGGSDV